MNIIHFGGGVWVSGKSPIPTFTTKTFLSKVLGYINRLAMSKICSKCGLEKLLTEFSTNKPSKKDGHNSWCKQCCRDTSKKYSITAVGVYSSLKGLQRYYRVHRDHRAKPLIISKKDFVEWYDNEPKVCHYCGIPEDLLNKTGDILNSKILRFTIDRKNNNEGYTKDNIVLACNRCNFMKSDYLTYEEMLFYAKTYITPKWKSMIEPKEKGDEDV